MSFLTQSCFRSVGHSAWCGLRLGFGLVLAYSTVFVIYAIVRSSLAIGVVLSPSEGLLGTLLANAFALMMAVLGFALLFGVIAALSEGLILLLVYGLTALFKAQHSPRRAAWIGLATAGIPAIALIIFVQQSLGLYFAALWPSGFFFWLGLPSLLFVGMTTWTAWQGATINAVSG